MNPDVPFDWQPHLDPNERLLWTGRPATGLRLNKNGLVTSAFGVPFLAFSLFWIWGASAPLRINAEKVPDGFALFFPLFGIPFVLIGFYMVVGQYFWSSYRRGRTHYALTDRRALIASRAWSLSIKSYPIDEETVLDYQPRADREASIFFDEETGRLDRGTQTVPVGFEHVADGAEVYRLMRQIQGGAA